MTRFQEAIASGVDPAALVEAINQAQREREVARAEAGQVSAGGSVSGADVYAMIDSLGDVAAVVAEAKLAGLSRLYGRLGLELR